MTSRQEQVAAEVTIAKQAWGRVFGTVMDAIAGCFMRREPRATTAELVAGLLLEVDTRNCWTLEQALGHCGPHRLQHLLSRARFDHERAREELARLVIGELAGHEVVLVVDETGDAKSSADCVGAGHQYSGALGGVGLCQVAVHLAVVTATTRVAIDRMLYLPADWAEDEERRKMAGVPEEITFATKPQQALSMVADALAAGIDARWFAADEVYCGRELQRGIRSLGLGYAVGGAATHQVIDGVGHRWEARQLISKVRPGQWMRQATGHGTKGTREYDWAWLDVRPDDTPDSDSDSNGNGNGNGTSVLVAR
ncbi:IS701 family transposase [Streptomyces sp. NPDC004675]|uniref:IS701 family transposase n=1 Tax=Streptomyces sp. NPDC004675 TaxID=3154286 RepID=UPI0033B36EC0